jgi:lantibiotic transport system permease protein
MEIVMEEKDFLQKMENLNKPEVNADASRRQVRIAIMNAKKSATWGIWLLVIPFLFILSVTIKEFLKWDWGISNTISEWIGALDKNIPFASPVLFLLLPAVAAVINLLAIKHFVYDRTTRELIVTLKIKWLNIILVLISMGIIAIMLLYVVMENSAERAIHKMEQQQLK